MTVQSAPEERRARSALAESSALRTAPRDVRRPSRWSPLGIALGVYRFFYRKKVGLLLILALTVLALIGVVFPQVPADFRADPDAYGPWLEGQRGRFGGWVGPLSLIGAFSMFSSLPFAIVTVLLVLSIIACTTHRLPLIWQRATKPRLHVNERFFDRARLRDTVEVPLPPEQATERAREVLRGMRFRVLDAPPGPGLNLYADRHRFAPLGTSLAHLAFIVILLGVLITGTTGFREDQFTVAAGSSRDVGHDTGLTVEVVSFADTYHADGRPADYVSDVVLYDEGEQVARQEVRVNSPLRYDGIKFNQAFFGVAADLRVTEGDGTVLYDQGLPLEWTTADDRFVYSSFRLEGQDLLVYVIGSASGQVDSQIGAGQLRVELYPGESDRPIANEVITQGVPTEIEGVTFLFEREQKFTGLMVSRDHGAAWVYTGAVLLLIGIYLTMYLRHHRVWVRVHPQGEHSVVRIGCPDRIDLAFKPRFEAMARDLARPPTSPA